MENIAIIGGGPSGVMAAIIAKRNNPQYNIVIFESRDILSTLLPTGGGRCNITFADYDVKSFVQNYPRGEKFLYSTFNKFFVGDTLDFFKDIGIDTYVQDDMRIFPKSNKSADVVNSLKNEIKKLNIIVKKEKVLDILRQDNGFIVNNQYFDKVVFSIGGRRNVLMKSLEQMGHTIIPQKPALCGLKIKENYFAKISGVSLKDINILASCKGKKNEFSGDILFTHKGISGPIVYKISSVFSQDDFSINNPIELTLNCVQNVDFDLQKLLELNSQKEIINLLINFIPKSLAKILLEQNNIQPEKRCHQIQKQERNTIFHFLTDLKLNVISPLLEGEIVSSGGVSLKEIDSKTMMSKVVPNLYFCGEVIDVDGFCGGFNLQNCWSTGYVVGINL